MSGAISVVVVSFNTKSELRGCINAYLLQLLPGDDLIVVDNNSTDGTVEMLRAEYPGVRVIAHPTNAGFGHACNAGYAATKGQFVLFSNGDICVGPDFLNRIRERMEALPHVGILSPELRGPDERLIQMTVSWRLTFWGEFLLGFLSPKNMEKSGLVRRVVAFLQRKERSVGLLAGACMLVRRDMLDTLRGFDEDFELYFEDADLCVRCRAAGYQVFFTPSIRVFHALGQSGKSARRKIELIYRQSQIHYYRKHNSMFQRWLLKIYLALKFYVVRQCWRDRIFLVWFTRILLERPRRLRLVDEA